MNTTMMVAGYVWTAVVLLVILAVCVDYTRRWWQARKEQKARKAPPARNDSRDASRVC